MKINFKCLVIAATIVSLFLIACDESSSSGDDKPAPSSLNVERSEISPGSICSNGGVQIDMGFDLNGDNVLNPDEVTNTEYVCNGTDASSHPFVVYSTPRHHDTEVNRSASISIVFNTDMESSTIDNSTFMLKKESGENVPGSVNCSNSVAEFVPASPLNGDKYIVILDSSIENTLGVAMGYEYSLTFTAKNDYLLTFDSQGGSAVDQQIVSYDGYAVTPEDPDRVDYGFDGWYKDALCTIPWNFDSDTVISDTTLYAKWIGSVTISFETQGGSTIASQTVAFNGLVVEPAVPVKTDYVFDGWFKEAGFDTPWDFESDTVTDDITLYAKWISPCIVSFDSLGGSDVESQAIVYNNLVMVPSSPDRLFHLFEGWYRESSCITPWDFSSDVVTTDTTLYAKWVGAGGNLACDVNGTLINMKFVPGGMVFPAGGDDIETDSVTKDYWAGETEVTYELWYKVYTWATDSSLDHDGDGLTADADGDDDVYSFANTGIPGHDGIAGTETTSQEPVTKINWRDAMVWCNALTEYCNILHGGGLSCVYYCDEDYLTPIRNVVVTTNITINTYGSQDRPYIKASAAGNIEMAQCTARGFRLPTKNEWELAARYIGTTAPSTGGNIDWQYKITAFSGLFYYWTPASYASGAVNGTSNDESTSEVAWHNGNSDATTHVVGGKTPNALGIYDLSGNVTEWCFTRIETGRYAKGGNWVQNASVVRVGEDDSTPTVPLGCNYGYGMRIFRSAE